MRVKKNYILYIVLTLVSILIMWLFVITQPVKSNGIYLSSGWSLRGCGGGVAGSTVESNCPAAILTVPLCKPVSSNGSNCSNKIGFPFVVYEALLSSEGRASEAMLDFRYNELTYYLNIFVWALAGAAMVAMIAGGVKIIKSKNG